MDIGLKADLVRVLDDWLTKNGSELCSISPINIDETCDRRNANLMANAVEVVIDSMHLQYELNKEVGE